MENAFRIPDGETPSFFKRRLYDPELVLLSTEEFCAMFNLTSRAAEEWKKSGVISYIRIRNKVYYRLSDVLKALDAHTMMGEGSRKGQPGKPAQEAENAQMSMPLNEAGDG